MRHLRETAEPAVEAGGGGLGGLDGEPMGTDPHGYRPEPSVTGEIKGPMVPATLPEREIINRIERGEPLSAPGDPTREQMRPASGQPKRLKPMTWREIRIFMAAEGKTSDGLLDDILEIVTGAQMLLGFQNFQDFLELRGDYQMLLSGRDADLYWPPTNRNILERASILAFFTLHVLLKQQAKAE